MTPFGADGGDPRCRGCVPLQRRRRYPDQCNGGSWNMDFVTTTGNVVIDLLHNFHLECGARLHKLRVYETVYRADWPRGLRLSAGSRLGRMPTPMRWR